MASTNPSRLSYTTIALTTAALLTSAGVAYALYFDHRRRTDPAFRTSLRKQRAKLNKLSASATLSAEKAQKDAIRAAVEDANAEGFPTDPEETEGYFMQEVARGEALCAEGVSGEAGVEAALCFYRALKVYPQPRELIGIYDKTVPKVCDAMQVQLEV